MAWFRRKSDDERWIAFFIWLPTWLALLAYNWRSFIETPVVTIVLSAPALALLAVFCVPVIGIAWIVAAQMYGWAKKYLLRLRSPHPSEGDRTP